MFKEFPFARHVGFRRAGLVSLGCCLALMATACGGVGSNPAATPTTVMGFAPTEQITPPTGQPTEVSTPPNAPAGENGGADMTIIVAMQWKESICKLASNAQVEPVLGQPITAVTPGEDPDSIPGQTLYFCTYRGSDLAVVISIVDTGSPAAATQALQQQLASMQADDPSIAVTSQAGLGDQAFWTVSDQAGGYIVIHGGRVLGVILGGNIGDPAAHQADLKSLTESITGGL